MIKLSIGIIFGGTSPEHNVSLNSANAVLRTIDKNKYRVVPIGVTKKGEWVTGRKVLRFLKNKSAGKQNAAKSPPFKLLQKLNLVFPLIHGRAGEDGALQGLLEFLNIPFIGSSVLGSALGMDKDTQKRLLIKAGLPTTAYQTFKIVEWKKSQFNILRRINNWRAYPLFVKPSDSGSSIGISKVKKAIELKPAIKKAFRISDKILIEKAVPTARELECAIIGRKNLLVSGVGEIVPDGEFYDYRAKYRSKKTKILIPAPITASLFKKIQHLSLAAFKILECRDLARVDFLYSVGTKKLFINEINTIPGFTEQSMFPKLWEYRGFSFSALLNKLIKMGINGKEAYGQKSQN